MLYEELRNRTSAELIAIGFTRKEVAEDCAWVYEVKVLTASGSVVELDFAADDLGLVGARGPENDHDAAALVRNFGAEGTVLINDPHRSSGKAGSGNTGSSAGTGQGGGDDDGHDDGGDGEGGSSGSGSGGGGSSGSGSGGSGSGDGDSDGGEGGDSDGSDHDGGEGGDDGDGGDD